VRKQVKELKEFLSKQDIKRVSEIKRIEDPADPIYTISVDEVTWYDKDNNLIALGTYPLTKKTATKESVVIYGINEDGTDMVLNGKDAIKLKKAGLKDDGSSADYYA
jgi:hypothetical protein